MTTPAEIRALRQQIGWSQSEAAHALGMTRSGYANYEHDGPHMRPIPPGKLAILEHRAARSTGNISEPGALSSRPRYSEPSSMHFGGGVTMMTNDRATIIGKSGSGKTWYASKMLSRAPAYVVLTADDPSIPDSIGAMLLENAPDIPCRDNFDSGLGRQIIFIEDLFSAEGARSEAWDAVLDGIFRCGDRIVYFDELKAINPGRNPRPAIETIITQGRKRNIGVWTGMQRPVDVPRIALSQAEHFHILSVTAPSDRKIIADFIGEEEEENIPRERRMVLYCNIEEQWTLCQDLDEKRRARREREEKERIAPPPVPFQYENPRSIISRPLRANIVYPQSDEKAIANAENRRRERELRLFMNAAPPAGILQTVAYSTNHFATAISLGQSAADLAAAFHTEPEHLRTAIAWIFQGDHNAEEWVRRSGRKTPLAPPVPIRDALRAIAQQRMPLLDAMARGERPDGIAACCPHAPVRSVCLSLVLLLRDEPVFIQWMREHRNTVAARLLAAG